MKKLNKEQKWLIGVVVVPIVIAIIGVISVILQPPNHPNTPIASYSPTTAPTSLPTPTPLLSPTVAPTPTSTVEAIITTPANGSDVPYTFTAQGTVIGSAQDSEVWVIIHPTQTNRFWVEPEATLNQQNGTWRALIYIGELNIGVGEQFEIMAIVNPIQTLTQTLDENTALHNWPEAQISSKIIQVTRR